MIILAQITIRLTINNHISQNLTQKQQILTRNHPIHNPYQNQPKTKNANFMILSLLLKSTIINHLQVLLLIYIEVLQKYLRRIHRQMLKILNNSHILSNKPLNLIPFNKSIKTQKILQSLKLIQSKSNHYLPLLNPIKNSLNRNKRIRKHTLQSPPTFQHIKKSIFVFDFLLKNFLDQKNRQTRTM